MNSWENVWQRFTGLGSSKPVSSDAQTKRSPPGEGISDHAKQVARSIRGDRPAALFLQGVMPRSGTVFVGNLIQLHPRCASFPNEIWEVPFLSSLDSLFQFQSQFFATYSGNNGKLGENDFLTIFGAAFVNYLSQFISTEDVLFVKDPRVEHVEYFFDVFPDERLVLLMRDGRDVVQSTVRSWPHMDFESVCETWNRSARNCLRFQSQQADKSDRWLFTRYEDAVSDPRTFVSQFCQHFQLSEAEYPFDQIDSLPVQGSSVLKEGDEVDWKPRFDVAEFKPIGRWKEWTPAQKQCFKKVAGQTLIDCGYETDLQW